MIFRTANEQDLPAVAGIYNDIHTAEEKGCVSIGWNRSIYPTVQTARAALERGDLFVAEDGAQIVGAAIINQQQVDIYRKAKWLFEAPDNQVMVLHTLVISPRLPRKGYGREFVRFYEQYALAHGCRFLRMDTNAINTRARAMYHKLHYHEADILPCVFNGLPDVQLVLLEKRLPEQG